MVFLFPQLCVRASDNRVCKEDSNNYAWSRWPKTEAMWLSPLGAALSVCSVLGPLVSFLTMWLRHYRAEAVWLPIDKCASLLAQLVRICLPCRRPGFNPWVKKIPWRRKWQPTPVFLAWGNPMDRGAWLATLFLCIDCWRRLSYLFLLFFGTLHSDACIFPFLLCFLLLF